MVTQNTAAIVQKYLDLGLVVTVIEPSRKEVTLHHIYPVEIWLNDHHIERAIQQNEASLAGLTNENIALPMGQPIVGSDPTRYLHALDFDNPNFYYHWKASNPKLANTPTQVTGRGFHVLFTMPDSFLPGKSDIVSFIGADWYILVEPSLHPNGDRYEWLINPFTTPFVEVRNREALGLDLSRLVWEVHNYFDDPYAEYEDDDLDLY